MTKPTFMPEYVPNRHNTFALPVGHKVKLGDWFTLPEIDEYEFHPVMSPEVGIKIHPKIFGNYRRKEGKQ